MNAIVVRSLTVPLIQARRERTVIDALAPLGGRQPLMHAQCEIQLAADSQHGIEAVAWVLEHQRQA